MTNESNGSVNALTEEVSAERMASFYGLSLETYERASALFEHEATAARTENGVRERAVWRVWFLRGVHAVVNGEVS